MLVIAFLNQTCMRYHNQIPKVTSTTHTDVFRIVAMHDMVMWTQKCHTRANERQLSVYHAVLCTVVYIYRVVVEQIIPPRVILSFGITSILPVCTTISYSKYRYNRRRKSYKSRNRASCAKGIHSSVILTHHTVQQHALIPGILLLVPYQYFYHRSTGMPS